MIRVTVAENAQQGWIAAACRHPKTAASCSPFCHDPAEAAKLAVKQLERDEARQADAARDWAAMQARLPMGERAAAAA